MSANDGESDGAARADRNELRQVYVGVSGPNGSLSIGRHYGLYYDFIDDEIDRHRSHYSDAIVFGDLFVSNAIVFRSPDRELGHFGVLVELNGATAAGDAIDERVELAGTLRVSGVSLHAGYVHSPGHDGLLGLSVSRSLGALTVAGVFQQLNEDMTDQQLLSLAVNAAAGERTVRMAAAQ